METRGFFQFEIIINVLVSYLCSIWIPISCGSTAIINFIILSVRGSSLHVRIDVRFWRLNLVPALNVLRQRRKDQKKQPIFPRVLSGQIPSPSHIHLFQTVSASPWTLFFTSGNETHLIFWAANRIFHDNLSNSRRRRYLSQITWFPTADLGITLRPRFHTKIRVIHLGTTLQLYCAHRDRDAVPDRCSTPAEHRVNVKDVDSVFSWRWTSTCTRRLMTVSCCGGVYLLWSWHSRS